MVTCWSSFFLNPCWYARRFWLTSSSTMRLTTLPSILISRVSIWIIRVSCGSAQQSSVLDSIKARLWRWCLGIGYLIIFSISFRAIFVIFCLFQVSSGIRSVPTAFPVPSWRTAWMMKGYSTLLEYEHLDFSFLNEVRPVDLKRFSHSMRHMLHFLYRLLYILLNFQIYFFSSSFLSSWSRFLCLHFYGGIQILQLVITIVEFYFGNFFGGFFSRILWVVRCFVPTISVLTVVIVVFLCSFLV